MAKQLTDLKRDAIALGCRCDVCPLYEAEGPVFPEQHPGAEIVLVGDAPAIQEVRERRPFVGPAGNLLMKAIKPAGLRRNDIHWTNLLLCRPPENDLSRVLEVTKRKNRQLEKVNKERLKDAKAEGIFRDDVPQEPLIPTPMQCCAPRLDKEMEQFSQVIPVGSYAIKQVVGKGAKIFELRGSPVTVERGDREVKMLPTLHPSFVMRNLRWDHVVRSDLRRAVRFFSDKMNWYPPDITFNPTAEELLSFITRNPVLSCDVETDDIECLIANMRCIALGTDREVMVIGTRPIGAVPDKYLRPEEAARRQKHWGFYPDTELHRVLDVLRDWLTNENYIKVGHNFGYYDYLCIEQQIGVRPAPVIDTMLVHRLVASELPHSLGFVGSIYTDAPSWKTDREGNKKATQSESDQDLHVYCLAEGTQVRLADGTTRPIETIVRNKQEVEVLSYWVGRVQGCKVTDWHYTTEEDVEWWQIKFQSSTRGIVCTHDHEIITKGKGAMPASQVEPGMRVYDVEPEISRDALGALVGTLLGDSSLLVSPVFRGREYEASTAYIQGGHTESSGFVQRKVEEIPCLDLGKLTPERMVKFRAEDPPSRCQPFRSFSSGSMRQLIELIPLVLDESGKRRISREALDFMGRRGLAWLYMDDGCRQTKQKAVQNNGSRGGRIYPDETCVLCLQGFPREQVMEARDWFRERYGATTVGADNVLRLGTVASRKFALDIAQYLPPEARYKLPRIRGIGHWPEYVGVLKLPYHKPSTRKVISVEPYHFDVTKRHLKYKARRRYCLSVEGPQNFFTTEGLVHNCAYDVSVTHAVLEPMLEQIKLRRQEAVMACDHRLQYLCAGMHRVGMYVDQERRREFESLYVSKHQTHLKKIHEIAGRPLNPGSTQQLRKLLFQEWNLEPNLEDKVRFTKAGDLSTKDEVIRACLIIGTLEDHQRALLEQVRYYRKAQKLLGTYITKIRPSTDLVFGWDDDEEYQEALYREKTGKRKHGIVDPRTGRMHPGYNAHVTTSGRLSSSKPINAQNFPSKLRGMVRAASGHMFVGADADQLELRIAAARWKSVKYLDAFDRGLDPHSSVTALAVFGDKFIEAAGSKPPWPTGTKFKGNAKKMRGMGKLVQYLSQYKGSPETAHRGIQGTEVLADDGYTIKLPFRRISLREVRLMMERWSEGARFEWGWDREIHAYKQQGFLIEPVMGRRRDFLDGENVNEIVNFPIQAAGASLMNIAILEVLDAIPFEHWGPGTGIINQCHDSIAVECPLDGATLSTDGTWNVPKGSIPWKVKHIIEEAMNQTHPGLAGVTFTAEAEYGLYWDEV